MWTLLFLLLGNHQLQQCCI